MENVREFICSNSSECTNFTFHWICRLIGLKIASLLFLVWFMFSLRLAFHFISMNGWRGIANTKWFNFIALRHSKQWEMLFNSIVLNGHLRRKICINKCERTGEALGAKEQRSNKLHHAILMFPRSHRLLPGTKRAQNDEKCCEIIF